MRLAGIGWSEHRGYSAPAQYHRLRCQCHGPADEARVPQVKSASSPKQDNTWTAVASNARADLNLLCCFLLRE
jgi:hypothetical protein